MSALSARRGSWGIVRGLGGTALALALVGLVFAPLSRLVFPERVQREVMVQAIPFVALFAAVILLFILLVALVARWLHGRVPHRSHQALEYVLIAGILLGIVYLFQPLSIAPYRYGFGLLLASTLAFILWSHVTPRSAAADARLPPYPARARTLAGLLGLATSALILVSLSLSALPSEPYGFRQRQWDSFGAERQAEVALAARADYARIYLPALALYGLLPGLAVFFLSREALTPKPALLPDPLEDADPDDTGPVAV